ncbi:hypothetical protein SAMN05660976_07222 [Nonomuraea pusilla]|uniref:Uncharacterized protein n=1 Tax=Nonomuraea pusilla TaxID=46177 RepID=A0A1H8FBJ8_9ACTN|nr:hypothetical protein SAMN05660976_07222 [Nonomuraea pusilla]
MTPRGVPALPGGLVRYGGLVPCGVPALLRGLALCGVPALLRGLALCGVPALLRGLALCGGPGFPLGGRPGGRVFGCRVRAGGLRRAVGAVLRRGGAPAAVGWDGGAVVRAVERDQVVVVRTVERDEVVVVARGAGHAAALRGRS